MLDLSSDSDSDSDSNPDPTAYPHPSPSSGAHQECTCPGLQVTVPEGQTLFTVWPWLEYEEMAMSTSVLIENRILTLWSMTCMRDGAPCHECQRLKRQLPIDHIQEWIIHSIPECTPYKFLHMNRMVELLRWKDHQINELKLASLNWHHRLGTLTTSNLDYKWFAMAVSQCDALHVNVLVQSTLWKKHGIREIIHPLTRATLGTYCPQYTEEQHLMSMVLYQLGGTRVAEFTHAALGTPGLSTVWKHCMTSILASSVFPKMDKLMWNIESAYEHSARSAQGMVGLICMFDEIKVEEGLDWCPQTNSIIGLCWEHSSPSLYIFSNLDDAQVICEDLQEQHIHLGTGELDAPLSDKQETDKGISGNCQSNWCTYWKPPGIYCTTISH